MARVRMVTRTIEFTNCEVMVVDTSNKEVYNKVCKITGSGYTDEQLLKLVEKDGPLFPDEKPVTIVSKEVMEQVYGMPESDFLLYARPVER